MEGLRVSPTPFRQRKPKPVLVSVVGLVALLSVACGSGENSKKSAGAPQPGAGGATTTTVRIGPPPGELPPGSGTCTLVTESQVSAAVGAPVQAVGAGSKAEGQVCTFSLEAKTPPQTVLVVTATNPGGPSAFEAARKDAGSAAQVISGVGDRAFANAGQVVAIKGNTIILVLVALDQPRSALTEAARTLAAAVVTRL